ncbi:DUF1758 domain-containing protein [Trichonephila clavipes]|nr:DUF1758 domain-containing protein [Trichonephila clavipes]
MNTPPPGLKKFDFDQSLEREQKPSVKETLRHFLKLRSTCVEEELNDYEKLKSVVLRKFQLTPRECLNSFKNAVKSSGETYIQFAARLTANFQYYCSLRKVNTFESLCDLIISDKLFETLNKETATHIGIREAEDWFRPIDLAKECDIYISSRSGSHSPLVSMKKKEKGRRTAADSVQSGLPVMASSKALFARRRSELKLKLLD